MSMTCWLNEKFMNTVQSKRCLLKLKNRFFSMQKWIFKEDFNVLHQKVDVWAVGRGGHLRQHCHKWAGSPLSCQPDLFIAPNVTGVLWWSRVTSSYSEPGLGEGVQWGWVKCAGAGGVTAEVKPALAATPYPPHNSAPIRCQEPNTSLCQIHSSFCALVLLHSASVV